MTRERSQPFRLKRLIAQIHSWTGAIAFILIVVVTLSGVASAFLGDLFRLQYPDLYGQVENQPGLERVALDELVTESANTYDGRFFPLGANLPGGQFDIDEVFVYGGVPDDSGGGEIAAVVFDPYTGELLGTHSIFTSWAYLTVHFHEELLLGDRGAWIVAVSGILLLLFILTGIYQWLPRRGRVIAKATKLKLRGNGRAKMFQLHGLIGLWFAAPLALFAITGTYIAKPHWMANALPEIQAKTTPEIASKLTACEETNVSLTDALLIVEEQLPGRDIIGLTMPMPFPQLPPEDAAAFSFGTRAKSDLHKHDGDERIWVSAKCPGLFHIEQVDRSSIRESLGAMVYSLHSGRTVGVLRLPFVIGTGLIMILLSIAGLYVWWTKTFNFRR